MISALIAIFFAFRTRCTDVMRWIKKSIVEAATRNDVRELAVAR